MVVLKGGAGSGFHGHRGRPGKQGGSLPEGTVAAKKIREPKFLNAENMSDEDKARIKTELAELADRLGFPVDKLIYSNREGDAFRVDENNYETAMSYSPKTGDITIFSSSLLIKDGVSHINEPLVAHEVMHDRFHIFEKQLHRQEALINKLASNLEDNPVLDDNFMLRSDFAKEYWAVDIKQRYYQNANMRELLYQIPVTDYGKSYIEVARKSTYGVDTSRAISENLAEVAAYSDDPNVFVSTRWSKLYNEINQNLYSHSLIPKYVPLVTGDYVSSNKELIIQLKGGVGSGFHGHKGIPGHQGGSLPSGSIEEHKKPKELEPIIKGSKLSPEMRERIRRELNDYAKKFGIPADKLIYDAQDDDSEFNVGSNKYTMMGEYDPANDAITLYPGSMTSMRDGDHIRGEVIAHEVEHSRFTKYWYKLEEQETIINTATDETGNNPYLIDGVLKTEYEDKFWAYKIKADNYGSPDKKTALYDQPISGYGGDYIKKALRTKRNPEIAEYLAIGENLADISASHEKFGFYIITEPWVKLYNDINQSLYEHQLISIQPQTAVANWK
jgi:hypothetical protein